MSIRLMTAVGELRIASRPKLVLLKLSDCANDEGGNCYPSIGTLATYAGTSPRHTQRIMAAFQRLGIVDIEAGEKDGRGKTRRYHLDLERARTLIPQIVKGDTTSPFYDPLKGDMGDVKGDMGDTERVTPESPDPLKNHQEPGAREREADGGRPNGPPSACAVWRENRTALEAMACWPLLERAIPDHDEGEVLTLAVEMPLVGFAILTWAAPQTEVVLGRRLACRVRRWVGPALIDRGVPGAGVPDASAHRRDGEIVTLNDPAGRLWCSHAGEIEALPAAALLVDCLPDDLDQSGLHLCTDTMATRYALHEEAGAQAAKVLGVAIVPKTRYVLDVILAARAAVDAGERGLQAAGAGEHG